MELTATEKGRSAANRIIRYNDSIVNTRRIIYIFVQRHRKLHDSIYYLRQPEVDPGRRITGPFAYAMLEGVRN